MTQADLSPGPFKCDLIDKMVPHPFRCGLEPASIWKGRGQHTKRSRNIQSQEIEREVGKFMMTFEY